ncbi:MAG: AI-2E family transporter [Breznakibacter sp.]
MRQDLQTIKRLLMVIVVALVIFLFKTLDFIFVPLVGALFLALLFMPLMRWLYRHRVGKYVSATIVILLVATLIKLGWELVRLSGQEIVEQKAEVLDRIEAKLDTYLYLAKHFLGVDDGYLHQYIEGGKLMENVLQFSGTALKFLKDTISMGLITVFFLVLLLIDTVNVPKIMQTTLFHNQYSSVKTFMQIERSIVKFIEVKFLMSLFTGVGFTLACYLFGVSFPLFWGLLAFTLNYIQLIGAVVATTALALFALAEIAQPGSWAAFVGIAVGIQLLFGSVIEPILMGKSFSINTITILIMLMFWGYIWGIPGMVLSIPITVLLKIVFARFKQTQLISDLMS